MISEKEKEEIRKEAKVVLDNFASALEKVELKEKGLKKHVGGFREEENGNRCDEDFRKGMFDNAPETKGDFIVAEKRRW